MYRSNSKIVIKIKYFNYVKNFTCVVKLSVRIIHNIGLLSMVCFIFFTSKVAMGRARRL